MKTLLAMLEAARVLAPLAANAGPFAPSRETLHAFVQGLIAHADGGGLTGRQAWLVVRAWKALMARRESVDALRRLGNLEFLAEVAARLERHAERTRGAHELDNAPWPHPASTPGPEPLPAPDPVAAPVADPVADPVAAPVDAPVADPVDAPVDAPVADPVPDHALPEELEPTATLVPLDMDALVAKAAGLFSGIPDLFGYLCVTEQVTPEEDARCLLLGTQGEGASFLFRKDLVLASTRWSHITRVLALPQGKGGQTKIVLSLFTFADKRTFDAQLDELQNLFAQPMQPAQQSLS